MAKSAKQISRDKELNFEKERLLNLIASKIERDEMALARGLAEELYKKITEIALIEKARQLRKCNAAFFRITVFLIGISAVAAIFMVMNVHPSLNLLMQISAVTVIIFAFAVNLWHAAKVKREMEEIIDLYEKQKQPFIERLLDNIVSSGASCRNLSPFGLTHANR